VGQKYDRNKPDQVELLKAAVIAQARVEWREAATRDWDERLARIVAGHKPARDEERARAVALDLANALSAYERLRSPRVKRYRKHQKQRRLSPKYKYQQLRRAEKRRKHRRRLKRYRSPAAASIVEAIDRHFEPVLVATEEHDDNQLSVTDFLLLIGTPTPPMAPRVRVASMPIEVWGAFGLAKPPSTRLLAIASLLLGNFPDLPAEKTRFSVADVIQLEANGIRSSLRNVKKSPDRARLVVTRAAEEVARHLARTTRWAAVRAALRGPPRTADD
jgi:hypothetical protein